MSEICKFTVTSMAFVCFILALLALTYPSFAQECKCSHALRFRGDVTQYGISKGSPEALKSITACFWMSIPTKVFTREPSMLSYSVPGSNNEVLLWHSDIELRLSFMKAGLLRTGVYLADGQLHHVCVTWVSSSGDFKVYKDGALVKTLAKVRTGHQIKAGGIWVIGQDQDSLGGGFENRDSFKGNLTEVNVWNRALCPNEIARLSKDCGSLVQGNYKAFSDFVISDATGSIPSPCCQLT